LAALTPISPQLSVMSCQLSARRGVKHNHYRFTFELPRME